MTYKKELIRYRRLKAHDTIKDANMLYEAGSYSSSVNRIYYAVFYEVTALLLTKGQSSSKHTGIRSLFNENYVKNGIVSKEAGRFYSSIFDFRQKSDYGDFVQFDEAKVKEWLSKAVDFIREIEGIIEVSECIEK